MIMNKHINAIKYNNMQACTPKKVLIPLTFPLVICLSTITMGSPHLEPPDLYKTNNIYVNFTINP